MQEGRHTVTATTNFPTTSHTTPQYSMVLHSSIHCENCRLKIKKFSFYGPVHPTSQSPSGAAVLNRETCQLETVELTHKPLSLVVSVFVQTNPNVLGV